MDGCGTGIQSRPCHMQNMHFTMNYIADISSSYSIVVPAASVDSGHGLMTLQAYPCYAFSFLDDWQWDGDMHCWAWSYSELLLGKPFKLPTSHRHLRLVSIGVTSQKSFHRDIYLWEVLGIEPSTSHTYIKAPSGNLAICHSRRIWSLNLAVLWTDMCLVVECLIADEIYEFELMWILSTPPCDPLHQHRCAAPAEHLNQVCEHLNQVSNLVNKRSVFISTVLARGSGKENSGRG